MNSNKPSSGPLEGLNVIDFGHYFAGPMVAMMLADQGANVIRIAKPGIQELNDPQYRLLNRNKNLLELDLKTPKSKAEALSLIAHADVLIENFRPGVMTRLGLDYASVKDSNPTLVYLSLPGFASSDKERAQIQAWEGVIGAATGLYTDTSVVRKLLHYPPVYTWVPQGSMYAAVHGSIAVMAALLAREEHGYGTVIEVPLSEASLSAFGTDFIFKPGYPAPFREAGDSGIKAGHEVPEYYRKNLYSSDDTVEVRLEKIYSGMRTMLPIFYSCADGRKLQLWSNRNETFYKAIGIDRQLKREGFIYASAWEVGFDNNACGYELEAEREKRLNQLIAETFLTKTAEEWEAVLGNVVAVGVVRTREEWLALKPLLDSGVFTTMDNGKSVLTVPGRIADIGAPEESSVDDYREVLRVSHAQAAALFEKQYVTKKPQGKPPVQHKSDLLKGLNVLDMANIVAGPAATYTLAQYGASVIKLDSPNLLVGPYAQTLAMEVGQGKRSLLADIKTAPGQKLLQRLVSWADVVVHNNLDDVAERLGVCQKQLQSINPKVVSVQLSAFGGTLRGGWELRNGWDILLQGISGLMAEFGTLEEPHEHGKVSAADYLGGLCLAFTSLLTVWQQRKTGYAGEGRTSLARAVNAVQLPYMIAENGRSDWGEAHGQLALGDHWWQRLYECSDGWLYVGTSENRAMILAETVVGQRDTDEQTLEVAFIKQNCDTWLQKLSAVDIGGHRVVSVDEICRASKLRSVSNEEVKEGIQEVDEVLCWKDHPGGVPIIMKAPTWVRVGERPTYKRLHPSPIFGQHSKDILREFGYSEEEIGELISIKVVHEYQPGMGSKDAYWYKAVE